MSYELQGARLIVFYELQATSYELQVTSYELWDTSYEEIE
jgi:hypothetical protein